MNLQSAKLVNYRLVATLVSMLVADNVCFAEQNTSQKAEQLTAEIQALTEQLETLTSKQGDADTSHSKVISEQANITQTTTDADTEAKLWRGSIEFGFVDSNGNNEETTVKGRAEIYRETEQWQSMLLFNTSASQTDGINTAEKYFLANRLSYKYCEQNSLYGYHSYEDDRFSGFDYITTLSMGYGRTLLASDTMQWNTEIGPGYRYSNIADQTEGEDSEEAILRIATDYQWKFSANSTFSQDFDIETGNDNTISSSRTALEVKVIGEVAIVWSYSIKYKEQVPAGTRHADTETAVTVSYSF